MKTVIVVGNPKAQSKTASAAMALAAALGISDDEITLYDLPALGVDLLEWGNSKVDAAVKECADADLLVVASPTYKGSFTGLTKLFLDCMPYKGLSGVMAIPLMLGANERHAMAVEMHLKSVLVELGAACPTEGLYILEKQFDEKEIYSDFYEKWKSFLRKH
ncbi:NAD(P)H-dependent oxidoreductase [Methylonatrum kenyense]|uniref:NADPH-dependent FMN reductase n=1 Tax=Methylonatrum kenyense TaxID=455253 RepID=UPI0020C08793|nr:NAD(P)H-dependent oxidoreductase [Methylonatrum kenyense]MCK8517200.1 NAD(P)H-dependent oxidoreductase [Methylonatrum kenyense]